MSDFIPNSFQMPTEYVDRYFHLLTSDEVKVLTFAVRHTFGFSENDQDRISLFQFANGTGLSESATRKILASLKRFNLLIAVDPESNGEEGPFYTLQVDEDIDDAGLASRLSRSRRI